MKKSVLISLLIIIVQNGFAQIGINTNNPDPNVVLEISSDNMGILIPKLTTFARTNYGDSTLTDGVMVYDSQIRKFYAWDQPSQTWNVMNPWFLKKDDIDNGGNMFIPKSIAETITIFGELTVDTNLFVTDNLNIGGDLIVSKNIFTDSINISSMLPNLIVETNENKTLISVDKNTAYNKNFGTAYDSVARGNHIHSPLTESIGFTDNEGRTNAQLIVENGIIKSVFYSTTLTETHESPLRYKLSGNGTVYYIKGSEGDEEWVITTDGTDHVLVSPMRGGEGLTGLIFTNNLEIGEPGGLTNFTLTCGNKTINFFVVAYEFEHPIKEEK